MGVVIRRIFALGWFALALWLASPWFPQASTQSGLKASATTEALNNPLTRIPLFAVPAFLAGCLIWRGRKAGDPRPPSRWYNN